MSIGLWVASDHHDCMSLATINIEKTAHISDIQFTTHSGHSLEDVNQTYWLISSM